MSVQLRLGQTVWVLARNHADEYSSYHMCFTGAMVLPQPKYVDDDDVDDDDDDDDDLDHD